MSGKITKLFLSSSDLLDALRGNFTSWIDDLMDLYDFGDDVFDEEQYFLAKDLLVSASHLAYRGLLTDEVAHVLISHLSLYLQPYVLYGAISECTFLFGYGETDKGNQALDAIEDLDSSEKTLDLLASLSADETAVAIEYISKETANVSGLYTDPLLRNVYNYHMIHDGYLFALMAASLMLPTDYDD